MNANNVPLNGNDGIGPLEFIARNLSSLPLAMDAPHDDIPAAARATAVARLMADMQARDTILVDRTLYTRYAPGLSSSDSRAIAASGTWSGIGFIGASALAAGVLMLTRGGAGVLAAFGLVLGGGALAIYAWRRAWNILDRLDHSSAVEVGAIAPTAVTCAATGDRFALGLASAHPRSALAAV